MVWSLLSLEQPVPPLHQTFHRADMMWGSKEDEVLAGMKKLFLDEEDIDCNLKKFFDRLRRCNLKLNPAKCAFGVPGGKLLEFIVNRRGIELDPSKVKEIQDLPPPKNKKDVMSFLGRLNYTSRFTAQSTVICEPIFKMLRKDAATSWNEECQKAFDKIKEYLSKPPRSGPTRARKTTAALFVRTGWSFRLRFGTT
uniref:Uncharacterized mitochondrial protein AtMg00860-like n=1 Tax=Nicotiana tabacum TaxID=4097 RepID=A0A1S3XTM6_TOBAC|nr:PREDICTED: uncharacterized mitochondrial protein AtMg00860-like [Nicotiana tabacum]